MSCLVACRARIHNRRQTDTRSACVPRVNYQLALAASHAANHTFSVSEQTSEICSISHQNSPVRTSGIHALLDDPTARSKRCEAADAVIANVFHNIAFTDSMFGVRGLNDQENQQQNAQILTAKSREMNHGFGFTEYHQIFVASSPSSAHNYYI